ncbi:YkgJ family cysteine cluster protein [Pajaroellobacter abortibovis]|uniref:YkgJ family cysteine cluster protein n=1 Tax=Pajaroellobacter abortibovis TaxID=1882918 RepID=A0A1L6MYV6_9BACT|nr:YkgJ family cysteine cluster protein [Pajaroellobacter abortibovis]APS00659.1 hypothetical protein BCY86_08220 [Pajaroellobacter abortibovis]
MDGYTVVRPVVREFNSNQRLQAAAHVRAGGHVIFRETASRTYLIISPPRRGDGMDLGLWSLLDLGKSRYRLMRAGILRGLAFALVPRDCYDIVQDRIHRDSIYRRAVHRLSLNCLQCGACCKDNRVELGPEDVLRFRQAGRLELSKPPYTKRSDGKLILRLTPSKTCFHLGADRRCAIYPFRPDACSQFPRGSECCLHARERELGLRDGAPRVNVRGASPQKKDEVKK